MIKAPMLSVDEALDSLLGQVGQLTPETVLLERADGLVLAESVSAGEDHPTEDNSAMDGYAVCVTDLDSASQSRPVTLTLLEDIAAGSVPQKTVQSGFASRISTGGLVPEGADGVVVREVVEVLDNGQVSFSHPATEGQNIRHAGEHLKAGQEVLKPGMRLSASEIGMAAYLGRQDLLCHPRVRVAVLATGSELVATDADLGRAQIRDSNSVALAAAVRQVGGEVVLCDRVVDRREALDAALAEAFEKADVVLTSGGISAGWHDLVKERIENLGGDFAFHRLRMRPGKPLAFGQCGEKHFFCLPGNPVSTLVTYEVFVKPALLKLMGRPWKATEQTATLTEKIEKRSEFTIFFRGRLDSGKVRLTGPQGSHQLKSLVDANVLIRAQEGRSVFEAGTEVHVLPFGLE